jgi:hypothetical protein
MKLLDEARRVLERAEYRVFSNHPSSFHFEDETVMGVLAVFESGEDILTQWRDHQTSFLLLNAAKVRNAGIKSWNIYSVFLADVSHSKETARGLMNIEEDFQSTRKIAQANLMSTADIVRSLLPLIPIQNIVQLRQDHPDATLRDRISDKRLTALLQLESVDELVSAFLSLQ